MLHVKNRAWSRAAVNTAIACAAAWIAAPGAADAAKLPGLRQRLRMDADWKFHLGELPGSTDGVPVAHWRWKADDRGEASAAEMAAPDLSAAGSDWKDATDEDVFHGRRGFAWYRTSLSDIKGPGRTIAFENVDDNATVYLNGKLVGRHVGWGTPFDLPLDSAWKEGGPNVLAVLVENTAAAGGIMGPVALRSDAALTAAGAADPKYNDRSWRKVSLPHDFVVEGTFDPKASVSHGFLPTNVGWYRKRFTISSRDRDLRLFIDFDGIYRDSTVWFNGHRLGHHASGYTSFRYDITPFVHYNRGNVVTVRADARHGEGWWYEGGGIYRHVWLTKTAPVHVAQWGTYISTHVMGSARTGEAPTDISMQTTIVNESTSDAACRLISKILNPGGLVVATSTEDLHIAGGHTLNVAQSAHVEPALLWSIDRPSMYTLVSTVEKDGRAADTFETPFGIRTIRFDPEQGFFLNDRPVKIQGTCNHTDFAGVGVALPDHLQAYKVLKLREMGSNAFRMSHNPPAPELLDACDRQGMLVMDENRHLGDTYNDHTPSGTSASDLSDLRDMILRDRNHPSIVMWSMCNEEGLQGSAEGERIFKAMMDVVHRYDTTRPITCAMNGGWGYGISNVEDLQGCNYNPGGYDGFHRDHPDMPMYGSETASTVSTRGIYANDPQKGYVSAYDVNAPSWAQTAEVAWSAIANRPFVAGGYVWTGFDYRGEPTPYEWPCINSHFGIMDTCGFPKDNWWYYKSWWDPRPIVHILPHWNWPGKEGQAIAVWCHSNCEQVELLLNGTSLGVKAMPRYGHVEWNVPYTAGKLEARGVKAGAVVTTDVVETTQAPAALELKPDRRDLTADNEDVVVVEVSVRDSQGHIVPVADNAVQFHVSRNARILGVGNGDPSSHEPDKASQRRAFNGRCLVIVQAGKHRGTIRLIADSPGLTPASVEFQAR